MNQLDEFYLNQEEPVKGTLIALRDIILRRDDNISNVIKYGMPFFYYKGKMFCYLWIDKKRKKPYIGIVEGTYFNDSFLVQDKRSRMKIMLLDANEDLPLERIEMVLQKAVNLYKSGIIKV
jgi:uncharacterized protein DUF1801